MNKMTQAYARQACIYLIAVLEDEKSVSDTESRARYQQAIESLCIDFGLTMFGSLPGNRNRAVPQVPVDVPASFRADVN